MMLDTAMAVREQLQAALPPALRHANVEGLAALKARRGLELMRAGQVRAGWEAYANGLRLTRRKATYVLRLLWLVPGAKYALAALRKWNAGR